MPPAFNLSQDQTLQFNSCFFASVPSSAPRLRSLSNGIESFLPCFHLLQCETLYFELAALLSLFPHLSVRCQVFKELLFAPSRGDKARHITLVRTVLQVPELPFPPLLSRLFPALFVSLSCDEGANHLSIFDVVKPCFPDNPTSCCYRTTARFPSR